MTIKIRYSFLFRHENEWTYTFLIEFFFIIWQQSRTQTSERKKNLQYNTRVIAILLAFCDVDGVSDWDTTTTKNTYTEHTILRMLNTERKKMRFIFPIQQMKMAEISQKHAPKMNLWSGWTRSLWREFMNFYLVVANDGIIQDLWKLFEKKEFLLLKMSKEYIFFGWVLLLLSNFVLRI